MTFCGLKDFNSDTRSLRNKLPKLTVPVVYLAMKPPTGNNRMVSFTTISRYDNLLMAFKSASCSMLSKVFPISSTALS